MIRIIILCMWISVLNLDAASIDGKNNSLQKVIVTGMGLDENKAIKNASKAAIQQVVGMYVVSDTILRNSKLIKDEVLTHSNAYIKNFKTINKIKNEDGLFEIEAEVEVKIGTLTNTLEKLNIATKSVGTDKFKAVALTNFSSSKEFKLMLQKIVMEPIYENRKIYDIKVNSFKFFQGEMNNFRIHVSWAKNGKEMFEEGELLPFELSFKFGLNDNYIKSIMEFLEHSSEQSSDFYIDNKDSIGIYSVTNTRSPNRYKVGSSQILKIKKSYLLSSRNKKIFNANAKINGKKFGLKISLMDKNSEVVKSYDYGLHMARQNNTPIYLKKKSMHIKNVHVEKLIPSNLAAFVGFLPKMRLGSSGRPFQGFAINKQELVTYMFLNEDEASRVSSVKIAAWWNK